MWGVCVCEQYNILKNYYSFQSVFEIIFMHIVCINFYTVLVSLNRYTFILNILNLIN